MYQWSPLILWEPPEIFTKPPLGKSRDATAQIRDFGSIQVNASILSTVRPFFLIYLCASCTKQINYQVLVNVLKAPEELQFQMSFLPSVC